MNRNTKLACATARSLSSEAKHWQQQVVTWGDIIGWTETPASARECGSYVLGTLRPTDPCPACVKAGRTDCLVRTARTVVSRSALVLDADHPTPDLMDRWEAVFPYAYAAHTTYNSAPDAPRYRIIIPTDRPMATDEYFAVAHAVMAMVGSDQWDPSCAQAARFMFKPSAQQLDWYRRWLEPDADPLPVDEFLADFDADLGDRPMPNPHRNKRDPFTLDGVLGAFNRAYTDTDELIEAYDLPYDPAGAERWQLAGARGAAGMGKMGEGLWFSHHTNDPAGGKACSAFDLVRLHRFGELDADVPSQTPINRLPSYTAMLDLAADDPRVTAELVGLDFAEEMAGDVSTGSWRLDLRLHRKTGKPEDVIENWDLIRANDPVFASMVFNEFTLAVECTADLPWRPLTRGGPTFNTADRAALSHYIEREYRVRPGRWLVDELVATTAQQHYVNPVKDYLDTLVWDGTPRLETCLPGVAPTPFTRMVARKVLVAAVARIYDPGCKWDHTLVLQGDEGLGKSWWVDRMSRGYSATLGRLNDKDTLITMQRSWIMVADEGFSLKKADSDVMKEFLTRREDVFRLPYERDAQPHPRHTVIWASINDEVFLRNQQGNRRFLIVRCADRVDFDAMTDDYVDQVWAEARHLYRAGERLFLEDVESEHAAVEREQFTEEDALVGVIEEYLDRLVPAGWEELTPEARQLWLANRSEGMVAPGTQPIDRVCSAQIWVEALGNRVGNHRRTDLLEINTALKSIPGWRALPGRHRLPGYGPQLVFVRTAQTDSITAAKEELL